jgi:hypothetical protein
VSSPLAGRPENERDEREKTRARAARVRRGMFLLPSLFTAGSIGAGYFAITQTIDSLTAAGNDGGASHLIGLRLRSVLRSPSTRWTAALRG